MRRLAVGVVCILALCATACSDPVAEARRLAVAGKLDEAEKLLDTACHEKKKARACVAAGMGHFNRGEIEEARTYALRAVELDDGDAVARLLLGNVHFERSELDDALTQYQRAAALDDKAAMPWANVAAVYLQRGQIDAAADAVDEALARNDELARAHHHRGTILLARGKLEEAQREWELAGELDEDYLPTWLALADLARLRSEPMQETSHLLRALALAPEDGSLHARLGQLYLRAGQSDAAVEEFRSAVSYAPTADNRRWLARGYLAVGQPRFAAAQLREASRLAPRSVDIRVDLALALLGANELQAAAREVDAVLEDHRDLAQAHFVRGLIYDTEGQHTLARRSLERAVELDPKHEAAHRELLLLAERRRDWKTVRVHLDALSGDGPAETEVQVARARLLAHEGRQAEAVNAMVLVVSGGEVSLDDLSEYEELAALRADPNYAKAFAAFEDKAGP